LGYIVDFYCPVLQLVIEVDGGIHNYRKEYDKKRDFVMFKYGFTVIRLTDRDVLFKTDKLLSLLNTLKSGTRSQVTTIKKT
jgi:very-short-patch-repair endonuclease